MKNLYIQQDIIFIFSYVTEKLKLITKSSDIE